MNGATSILITLLLGGLLGLIGQAVRSVAGVKKLFDEAQDQNVGFDQVFNAVRFFISLLIGFVAGMVAVLTLGLEKFSQVGTGDTALLLGIAAAGYTGADFIEAFTARLTSARSPTASQIFPPSSFESVVTPTAIRPSPVASMQVMALMGEQGLLHSTVASLTQDIAEANKYLDPIKAAASKYGLNPSLICAIGSRESRWGLILKPKGPTGTGDGARRSGKLPPDGQGWGRGLMQIDYAAHKFAQTGDWQDPAANIDYGCGVLMAAHDFLHKRFPEIKGENLLRAAVAAYNTGPGNVAKSLKAGLDVDKTTAGGDYSKDVMGRAAAIQHLGFDG